MKKPLKNRVESAKAGDSSGSLADLNLQQLRKARGKSQQELSDLLNVNQAEISKMERRSDMYISTLKNYIEAMGGNLEIIATFPDSNPISISQFNPEEDSNLSSIESKKKLLSRQQKPPRSDLQNIAKTAGQGLNALWYWSICKPDNNISGYRNQSEDNQNNIEDGWYQKLIHQPVANEGNNK